MKNRHFIVLLFIGILSLGFSVYSYLFITKSIETVNLPECKCETTKSDGNYHIDEKELQRLLYTIEEDSHFCRLGIQDHREEWENRSQDFTKLYLNK